MFSTCSLAVFQGLEAQKSTRFTRGFYASRPWKTANSQLENIFSQQNLKKCGKNKNKVLIAATV